VVGNDFTKLGVPFIICSHVYAKIGSYVPGNEMSGGGGLKYNASIILELTKSKLEDKESEERMKAQNVEATRIGIVISVKPIKQRFARPIKIRFHLPFYKPVNQYVGLENYVSWKNCGIIRGKALTEKEYSKLSPAEQKSCGEFKDLEGKTLYAQPKDTARTLVCKHLGGEIPLSELFTERVFTQQVLTDLDNNIIKSTFMLPSVESLEDLQELSKELGDDIITSEDITVEGLEATEE
jgi:hypothetical protein